MHLAATTASMLDMVTHVLDGMSMWCQSASTKDEAEAEVVTS